MKDSVIERRPPLTTQKLNFCLLHMLRDKAFFEFARERIKPTDFSIASEPHYGVVWAAALDVAKNNNGEVPATGAELAVAMNVQSRIEGAGDQVTPETLEFALQLVAWIFQFKQEQLNGDLYRPIIQELSERKVIRGLSKIVDEAREFGRPIDLVGELERLTEELRQTESVVEPSGSFRDEWAEYQARLDQYRGREMLGLRTGMRELDDRTLGLRGMILLGAMPNVGKTAFVLQLGLNAVRCNPDACFLMISLEMDRRDLYVRLHCNLAEMDYKTLVFGAPDVRATGSVPFSAEQQRRLTVASNWVANSGHRIRICDREMFGARFGASSVVSVINALKAACGASRALIAIDYLQLIPVASDVARNGDLEADKYRVRVAQEIVAAMRTESNPQGDAVLLISESRKPASGRRAWGEGLADLMGSARLGYAADAVLLYRRMDETEIQDAYSFRDGPGLMTVEQLESEGISPAYLTLAKGRDGMRRGEWGLEFHFNRSFFREIEQSRFAGTSGLQLPPGRRLPTPTQIAEAADALSFIDN